MTVFAVFLACLACCLGMEMAHERLPQEIAPGMLNPATVPKFVSQLVVPRPLRKDSVNGSAFFTLRERSFKQQILPPNFPSTTVFGYVGADSDGLVLQHTPGAYPVFSVNERASVVIYNEISIPHLLPVDPTIDWANPLRMSTPSAPWRKVYADAQRVVPTVPHFHGFEASPKDDGHPRAWITAGGLHGPAFESTSTRPSNNSRIVSFQNEQLRGWSFVHDHVMGATRLNVYAGLATFTARINRSDVLDTQLLPPAVPLMLRDASFFSSGELFFQAEETAESPLFVPEQLGNVILVNGVAWPNHNLPAGVHRFVLCNIADARFFNLTLSDGRSFQIISTGHGYLPSPLTVSSILVAPGERYEILLNLTDVAIGTTLQLLNSARAPFPIAGDLPSNNTRYVMQFSIVSGAGFAMSSPLPSVLSTVPPLITPLSPLQLSAPTFNVSVRSIVISEVGKLAFNLQEFMAEVSENPLLGTTEVWELINLTPDSHPIHIHLVAFQLHSRQAISSAAYYASFIGVNGLGLRSSPPASIEITPFLVGAPRPPLAHEAGWIDTFLSHPGEVTRIVVRFAPVLGFPTRPFPFKTSGLPYVYHCHMLSHEDNALMRPMTISHGSISWSSLRGSATSGDVSVGWKVSSTSELLLGIRAPPNSTWVGLAFPIAHGGWDLHIIETHAPASHVYRRGTVILDAFTTNLRNGSDWVNDRDTGGQNNLVLENSFVDENGSLIALYSRGHTGGSFDVSIDFRAPIDVTVLWGSDPSGSVTQAELVNALDFRVTFANYPRSPDLIAHTVLMSVAFCILVVMGILVSTCVPSCLVPYWFQLHVVCHVVALVLMVTGFALSVSHVAAEGEPHFIIPDSPTNGAHGVMGMILFLLMFVQAFFGAASDLYWRLTFKKTSKVTEARWFPEKTHWWFGRFIVIFSVVVIYLGIAEFKLPAWVFGVYTAWYGVLIVVLGTLFVISWIAERNAPAAQAQKAVSGKQWVDDEDVSDGEGIVLSTENKDEITKGTVTI